MTEKEACINRVTRYILQNIIFFNFIAYKIICDNNFKYIIASANDA